MHGGTVTGNASIDVGAGGTALFHQLGGDVNVFSITVGTTPSAEGEYVLEDGTINTEFFSVGGGGSSVRLQGGSLTVGQFRDDVFGDVKIGKDAGGSASLFLSGDVAINPGVDRTLVTEMNVGAHKDAIGSSVLDDINLHSLIVGQLGEGLYDKTGSGTLDVAGLTVGLSGNGSFLHRDGLVRILGDIPGVNATLRLGINEGSSGSYTIEGGQLEATGLSAWPAPCSSMAGSWTYAVKESI